MMRSRGLKPEAMLGVLASFAGTTEADLAAIPTQTLAVSGEVNTTTAPPSRWRRRCRMDRCGSSRAIK